MGMRQQRKDNVSILNEALRQYMLYGEKSDYIKELTDKEIYAMACVVGGTFYWMCHLLGMESFVCQIVGGVTVLSLIHISVRAVPPCARR